MTNALDGCTVAILVTEGFEQSELTEPRKALGIVTSRKPADIPAFNREMIALFSGATR